MNMPLSSGKVQSALLLPNTNQNESIEKRAPTLFILIEDETGKAGYK